MICTLIIQIALASAWAQREEEGESAYLSTAMTMIISLMMIIVFNVFSVLRERVSLASMKNGTICQEWNWHSFIGTSTVGREGISDASCLSWMRGHHFFISGPLSFHSRALPHSFLTTIDKPHRLFIHTVIALERGRERGERRVISCCLLSTRKDESCDQVKVGEYREKWEEKCRHVKMGHLSPAQRCECDIDKWNCSLSLSRCWWERSKCTLNVQCYI